MKIVVFGASGRTGLQVVQHALAAGHAVTALARTPAKIPIEHPSLRIVEGDAMESAAVEAAIAGQEAVISVLGPTRPPVPGMMETAAKNIVAAMKKHHVRRLVSTTGAGVRDPQDRPGLMDRLMKGLLALLAGEVLMDSAANVNVIQDSDLEWTIVRFPRLVDGPRTGKARAGYLGRDSGNRISRLDAAEFILKELEAREWLRKMPTLSS